MEYQPVKLFCYCCGNEIKPGQEYLNATGERVPGGRHTLAAKELHDLVLICATCWWGVKKLREETISNG